METIKIIDLLEKYYEGASSLQEEATLRLFFQQEQNLGELEVYRAEFLMQTEFKNEKASPTFKAALLEQYRTDKKRKLYWIPNKQTLQIAASLLLLATAFFLGRWSDRTQSITNQELIGLKQEINSLTLLSAQVLLKQPSARERLQGVEMLTQGDQSNTTAYLELLFKALNEDKNPNVRLASINALYNIERSPELDRLLFQSLLTQDSPILQIALLMMLKRLGVTLDADALESLNQKENLDQEVQNVIQQNYKL